VAGQGRCRGPSALHCRAIWHRRITESHRTVYFYASTRAAVKLRNRTGTSILVASQDPPSVPISLIELSSQIIIHCFNSPAWLNHIQKANAASLGLTAEQLARLRLGEAYVWSSKATDQSFSREAVKVTLRPRVTLHGGSTRTAV